MRETPLTPRRYKDYGLTVSLGLPFRGENR